MRDIIVISRDELAVSPLADLRGGDRSLAILVRDIIVISRDELAVSPLADSRGGDRSVAVPDRSPAAPRHAQASYSFFAYGESLRGLLEQATQRRVQLARAHRVLTVAPAAGRSAGSFRRQAATKSCATAPPRRRAAVSPWAAPVF